MTQSVDESRIARTLILVAAMMSLIMSLGAPLITTVSLQEHVALSTGEWMLTITLLVGALATPIMGRLADGPHQRPVIVVALLVVIIGLITAALSRTFPVLLIGRGLQGVGLGLVPVCMTIARTNLSSATAERTIATLSITAAIGVGIGYPLTSLTADVLSFHDSFWLTAVLVTCTAIVAATNLPRRRDIAHTPFDIIGALTLTGGLTGLLMLLGQGQTWGWSSTDTRASLVSSVVLLVVWVVYELHFAHPLINLRQLRSRTIAIADLVGAALSMAMYLFLPVMVEFITVPRSTGFGFGASILTSGLLLVPLSVATFLASRCTPWLRRRLGRRALIPLGSMAFTIGALLFTLFHTALWETFVASGLAGFGVGLSFAIMPSYIVAAASAHEVGAALGFYQLARNVGLSVGSALAGLILAHSTARGTALPSLSGFTHSTLLSSIVMIIFGAVALALLVPPATTSSPQITERMREGGELSATALSIDTEGLDE